MCDDVVGAASTMPDGMRLKPFRLRPGDRVRFVSPASRPEPETVAFGAKMVESWGLKVEIGAHAFDEHGHFLAGKDEDRQLAHVLSSRAKIGSCYVLEGSRDHASRLEAKR